MTKRETGDAGVAGENEERGIPRPDVSAAHIILLILAHRGPSSFRELMRHHDTHSLGVARTENSFYTAVARLKRRKHVARNAQGEYELTPAGEYAALKAFVRKELVAMEKKERAEPRWDGRWRLVFFDIPENRRPVRDYVRNILKRLGFREFQRSTWIYPHKLPGFLAKMLADPHLRKHTRVITTSDIDYDEDLRRYFRLR